jgi:4-hydroxybenzoate polyprenyltransferase
MVFARTAAMAYNRYADRKIDSINDRTREREIPSGKISSAAAITLVIISSLLFITTTYFINAICFYLSPVALAVVLGYSLTKRFTWLCHFILGLGLSLAPIGAYLAVTGKFDLLPLHFSAAVLAWVSGFDIIYALQDEQFDKAQHLHSVPARMGAKSSLLYARLLHLFSAGILIDAGIDANFGIWYWLGVIVFSLLLIYQHSLVKADDLSKVNLAFFTTNGVASIVFACFVVTELLKS